jgi:arabinose-5-phosphate isomerase
MVQYGFFNTCQQIGNIMSDATLKKLGLAVLETESAAVEALKSRIDDDFARACHYMLDCQGRVVVIGMGKSGHMFTPVKPATAIWA